MSRRFLRSLLLSLCAAMLLLPDSGRGASVTSADDARQAFERANAAYADDRFAEALAEYEAIDAAGFGSAQVLANAGNAAFLAEDVGRAVLFYMRALRIDPSNEVARENLRRIQPKTNVAGDEASFGAVLASWFAGTPPVFWYVLGEVAFVLLVGAIIMAGRAEPRTEARSAWLSRAAGAALATVLLVMLVAAHDAARTVDGDGVVMATSVSRSGPGEKYFQQIELPPGTVVAFKSAPSGGWVEFRLADGTTGFLLSQSVSAI